MSISERFTTDAFGRPVFVAADGDMLDQVARAYFGFHAGGTEAILVENDGALSLDGKLSAGTVVRLPERGAISKPANNVLELWD